MRPGSETAIACVVWLATALARAEPAAAPVPEVVVRAEGLDPSALAAALALRVPGARVAGCAATDVSEDRSPSCAESAGPSNGPEDMSCGSGCARAVLRREGAALVVEVRGPDGRVYRRSAAADGGDPERAAATSLAHLLAAIEEGSAAKDVVIEAAPVAVVRAEPPAAAPTCPPVAAASEPVRPAADEAPRLELGPRVGLAGLVGVGPPAGLAGWLGEGGLVGLELRRRRGLLVDVELRGVGARDGDVRLGRLRVAVAIGHSLRRGLFELRTRAAVTVEPWWTSPRGGGRAEVGGPLLGGALAVAPGLSAALAPRVRVFVGLRIEAAYSLDARRGAIVQLVDPGGAPLFRVGGLELGAAAEIGVRWGRR